MTDGTGAEGTQAEAMRHSSQVYGFAYQTLKRRMATIGVEIPPPEERMPGPVDFRWTSGGSCRSLRGRSFTHGPVAPFPRPWAG